MSILIGFICVLLSAFLLLAPSQRKQPNLFLAAFLALTAIELTVWLWGPGTRWTSLNVVWFALGKLQMPAFLFFFFSSCYADFRLRLHDGLHLIPFAFGLVLNWPGTPGMGAFGALFAPDTWSGWLLSQLIYVGYMTAIVTLLWQFRVRFRRHYAGGHSEVLIWLSQLAAVSLFARVIIIARDVFGFAAASPTALALQMFGAVLALAITSWIAMKSLLQPKLFRNVDRRLLKLDAQDTQTLNGDLERLLAYVETQKPYLNPELTLAALSDQVAMTPRELSELLNQALGVHFFDFINGHRIAYAQSLLVEYTKRPILQILLESGFNSKSSFNTAFKKHVGMTPSAYRSKMRL